MHQQQALAQVALLMTPPTQALPLHQPHRYWTW